MNTYKKELIFMAVAAMILLVFLIVTRQSEAHQNKKRIHHPKETMCQEWQIDKGFKIDKEHCLDDEPSVTPTPDPVVTPSPVLGNGGTPPTFAGSSTDPVQCGIGETTNVVANPHVIRNGADATVQGFITEGDSVNIYWSVVGQSHWGNSSAGEFPEGVKANADKFFSYTIHNLDANLGYDFGIQQKQGCGGGRVIEVIVDGPKSHLFQLSYFEYTK